MKKKRLIVKFNGSDFVNIKCDTILQDDSFLYGYVDGDLVAVFMIGCFDCAYLSEVKDECGKN